MNTFIISFDLISPGQDYQAVYDYIERYNDWIKPLQTFYLVHTSKSAGDIRDEIKSITDSNDKTIVIKVNTSSWATHKLPKTAEWLNKH